MLIKTLKFFFNILFNLSLHFNGSNIEFKNIYYGRYAIVINYVELSNKCKINRGRVPTATASRKEFPKIWISRQSYM